MPAIHGYVHCHVCPLKDLCEWEQAEISYKYQHSEPWEVIKKEEYEKLGRASNNCPLKKRCLS